MSFKNVEDFYPLSPMQQGMLFHSLYAPESGVYLEQMACTLQGDLDVSSFQSAWQRAVDRHTVLRTAFVVGGFKEPVQVVHRKVKLPLELLDWREWSSVEQEERLKVFLDAERRRGMRLSEPPLMRLNLIRTAHDTHQLVWSYHHALLDGWSIPVLLKEVFASYETLRRGQELQLAPTRSYRDYIAWLRRQDVSQAEAFWRHTLGGFSSPTPLLVRRIAESDAHTNAGYGEQEILLSEKTTVCLRNLLRQHQLTFNTLVQGGWALLLSRYSGEEEVLFGATVSGRPAELPGAESMMGLFINTLPVRVSVPPDAGLLPWLKRLQGQQAELRQYEYSPLVEIQGWSQMPRGLPLFESILVFENYPLGPSLEGHDGSLQICNIRSVEQTNYPLTFVSGVAERLLLKLLYDKSRFEASTIARMLGHLQALLKEAAANPQAHLSDLTLLTPSERTQILCEWNDTAADFPQELCAHQMFETKVEKTPDAIAVTFGEDQVTYRDLNRRANQLARHLRRLGVGPEVVVGLYVERSPEVAVCILGVLKAGGAYLPLDPTYPRERLAFLLEDARVPVLLTKRRLPENLPSGQARVVCLDSDWDIIAQEEDTNPIVPVRADNLAYVIYTSGSTGVPKGTLLQHCGLSNLTTAYIRDLGIGPGSRVLQFFSLGFDGSVADIFSTLLGGATLCLASQDSITSPLELIQLMHDQAITIALLPPSLWSLLPEEELPDLKVALSAGDICTREVIERWARGRRFFNAYGPTEASVAASWYATEDASAEPPVIPIGRPLANTQLYVLDSHRQPVPVGVPGELYIGGTGLARGYLNRPELTAEKFVANPFSDKPGARLYRTGDLARYRPDGTIEFVGRIDHQVKIRGFRIEIGEIEAALRQHPRLQEGVVIAREDVPGGKRLVAYVVPCAEPAPNVGDLRDFLRGKLPEHMVPSAFVVLQVLPLTSNGKVDRQALPAPDSARAASRRTLVLPRDTLELQLTQIWEDVLGVRPIGVTDSFFELGGHSLLAVRVGAQIQQRLNKTISLIGLFQRPTIEGLAHVLRQQDDAAPAPSLVPINANGSRRPLFFVHPSGGSVHWYADLARRLGADQPFYGFQAQGLNGDREIHTRIEDMAAHYVGELRTFLPEGPYLLGSWSMGVIVAFEMARQLRLQNQEVALLALLDQGPFVPVAEAEDDAAYLLDTFGKHVPLSSDHLRQIGADEQVAYVLGEAKRIQWIHPDVTLPQFQHFVGLLKAHTNAWRSYVPQIYPGRITLFRAEKQPESGPKELDLGWGQLAAGGVDVCEVTGDHLGMIHEPHVQALAERLGDLVDHVQTVRKV